MERPSDNFEWRRLLLEGIEAKYPTPVDTLPKEDVKSVNISHIIVRDKFWRMYAGSSCDLISFEDGVLEFEIFASAKHFTGKRPQALINEIASWNTESHIEKAHSFIAHVYTRKKAVGFAMTASQVTSDKIADMVAELDAPTVDVKMYEWRGAFPIDKDYVI